MSDDGGGGSNKGGTKGSNELAPSPGVEAPGLPGVSAGGGPTGSTGGGMDFSGGTGIGNVDFSYLGVPSNISPTGPTGSGGVESMGSGFITGDYGGGVPGYGATDLGGLGTAAPGTASPGVNMQTGTGGGPSAPGLPGVGGGGAPTDFSSQSKITPGPTAPGQPEASSILTSLGIKNPLSTAVGAGGLAYAMSQGQQPPKFSPEMQAQAARLDANGQQLMSYLQSGNLPPGLKASLDQASSAAKAKIISNFAAQGLNTDPNQNTALAQQLAQVDQQAIISTAQIGQQLMQSGITESGLASDLYKTLANIDQTQTAAIGKAIANFAAAISGGGGGGGTTIKVGG